jgi:hypothetical protein
LADAGVRVIGKPKNFPWSSVEARVTELTTPDGGLLTAEAHASCPGHAAFIADTRDGRARPPSTPTSRARLLGRLEHRGPRTTPHGEGRSTPPHASGWC